MARIWRDWYRYAISSCTGLPKRSARSARQRRKSVFWHPASGSRTAGADLFPPPQNPFPGLGGKLEGQFEDLSFERHARDRFFLLFPSGDPLTVRAEQPPPAGLGIARPQLRPPQTVLADKLLQLRRIFQERPHVRFFRLFLFRMFLHLARGLVIQLVGVVLHFPGESIWIERSLHHPEVLHEFEGNMFHPEIEQSLALVA